jgi:hypothetical protein
MIASQRCVPRRDEIGQCALPVRTGGLMTGREIAIEFTEVWESLDIKDINTVLAGNVSMELLEFFSAYAEGVMAELLPDTEEGDEIARRLPNLMIIGYLIRLLEERLRDE